MGDIRGELKNRLEEGRARLSKLMLEAEILEEELDLIETLYEIEQKKYGELKGFPAPVHITTKLTVREMILKLMGDGEPWTAVDLKDEIMKTGLLHDSRAPGRSLQAVLMNLVRYNKIEKTADDAAWILK